MTFRELSKEEFDSFTSKFDLASHYQTSSYAISMNLLKYKYLYLGMIDNDNILAATLILIKEDRIFKYGYAPRGILIDYNKKNLLSEFTQELKKYLSKKDIVALKVSPMVVKNIYNKNYELNSSNPNYDDIFNNLKSLGYNHLGYNNFFESLVPRFDAIIRLKKDNYSMFINMKRNVKTKTRSADENGVRIYLAEKDEIISILDKIPNNKYSKEWLKSYIDNSNSEVYYSILDTGLYLKSCQNRYVLQEKSSHLINEEVINRKGHGHQKLINKKIEIDKKLNICHHRLDEAIKLASKYPDGIILSYVICSLNNKFVDIVSYAYDKEYKIFNSNHLMIWKLMEKYGLLGYNYLNLGGITNNISNNKYKGLNDFKLSFGSNVYEYIGDFELVTNKAKYIMYKNTAPIFKK